jgi:hypothetical protein
VLHTNRADIDGFYGEPAAYDETLEVELVLEIDDDAFDDDDRVTAPIPRLIEVAPATAAIAPARPGFAGPSNSPCRSAAPPALEDAWFRSYDETSEYPTEEFDEMPTTTWKRLGDWLRNFRAA